MNQLKIQEFEIPKKCDIAVCIYEAKHWCGKHQNLCCNTCGCQMHKECSLIRIPDPSNIKDTLELLRAQLESMEKEGQIYELEHWYQGYAQDLQAHTERFDIVVEHTIAAFASKTIAELAMAEELILKFGSELEKSDIKSQLATIYYNHHHTPSLCGPTEEMLRETAVAERVREMELVLRRQMNQQKNEEMAILRNRSDRENERNKKRFADMSYDEALAKKDELQKEHNILVRNNRSTMQKQIKKAKEDFDLEKQTLLQEIQQLKDDHKHKIQQMQQDTNKRFSKAKNKKVKAQQGFEHMNE